MNAPGHISQGVLTYSIAVNIFSIGDKLPWYLYIIGAIITILGSWLPDIDLKWKFIREHYKRKFNLTKVELYHYHRQITHSILLFSIFCILLYFKFNLLVFFLLLGIGTHFVGDMLTGSIPIGFYGKYYSLLARIGTDRLMNKETAKEWNKKVSTIGDYMAWPVIAFSICFWFI